MSFWRGMRTTRPFTNFLRCHTSSEICTAGLQHWHRPSSQFLNNPDGIDTSGYVSGHQNRRKLMNSFRISKVLLRLDARQTALSVTSKATDRSNKMGVFLFLSARTREGVSESCLVWNYSLQSSVLMQFRHLPRLRLPFPLLQHT